jgi:hypothetical protein
MKEKINKLSVISEIYANFTKENKENLMRSAASLLKIQTDDTKILANTKFSKNQNEDENKV